MKTETFDRILDGIPNSRKEAGAQLISEENEITLYVALPSEVLSVTRVSRIERGNDIVTVDTHTGDRYYIGVDHIAMIKVGAPGKKAGTRGGAGFR